MVLLIPDGGKTYKFEFGGSLATGTGIAVWYSTNGGKHVTSKDGKVGWNGHTYRFCK